MRISDWSSDVCSSDLLVETAVGRRLMSNFHGMYSLGAISGALMLTGLLTLGLAPEIGSFLMIGLIVAANLGLARGFLPNRAPGGGFAFVRPTGVVLLVGLMCFVVYLAEGAVLVWSALYRSEERLVGTECASTRIPRGARQH